MNKEYLFKIDDKVRIKEGTEHYIYSSSNNPRDMDGIVILKDIFELPYKYRVQWANGESNSYRDSDLVLVSSKKDVNNEETLKKENAELKAEIALLKKQYDDLTYFANDTSKKYVNLKKEYDEKNRFIAELQRKIYDLSPRVVIEPISEDKVEPKKRRLI